MATRKPSRSRNPNRLRIIGGAWRGRKLAFPDGAGLRPTPDRVRETLFNWLTPILPGARCLDLFAGSGALGLEALSRGAAQVVLVDRDARVITQLREHIATLKAQGAELIQADALQFLQNPPYPPFTKGGKTEVSPFVKEEEIEEVPPFEKGGRRGDLFEKGGETGTAERVYMEVHPGLPREAGKRSEEGRGDLPEKGGRGDLFDIVFLDPPYHQNLLEPCCRQLENGGWLTAGARIYLEAEAGAPLDLPQNWRLTHSKKAGQVGYHLAIRES